MLRGKLQSVCSRLRSMVFPAICPLCLDEAIASATICNTCYAELDIIHGKICNKCGGPLITEHSLCKECSDNPRIWWKSAASAFCFEGLARSAVHRFKYHKDVSLVPFLAESSLTAWKSRYPDVEIDCIVPVPLHWLRKLKRGYNQSEMICNELARRLEIPVCNAVRRSRWTPPQASLSKANRGKNLKNAFIVSLPECIQGKVVLLFDDVMTTGVTLSECSRSMIKAGAKEVHVLTIARRL